MKPDKKQLPQLIVLGLLLLACIGYVGMKVTSKPAPAPAQPAPAATAQAPAGENPESAKTEDSKAESTIDPKNLENVNLLNLPPVQKRDPFAPRMVAQLPRSYTAPTQFSTSSVRPRVERSIGMPRLPVPSFGGPMHVEPVKVNLAGISQGSTGSAVSADPAFKVTGIIRGSQNVAIIRADEERHIVREGQWINGTYKVVSVTEDGVVLVSGNRRISLKLGGEKNAS